MQATSYEPHHWDDADAQRCAESLAERYGQKPKRTGKGWMTNCPCHDDSDWGFVAVDPWGRERTKRFFDLAAPAFREPEIGRRLRTHLLNAGFADVDVRVQAGVDTAGGSMLVLRNMASYAAAFDATSGAEADVMLAEAEAAINDNRYLFCLPQFLVTGVRP